jgi:hypothetical protein
VCKSSWNINLVTVFRAEDDAGPSTEVGGTLAYIQHNVESLAFDDATQLCLRVVQLIVQPAERAFP